MIKIIKNGSITTPKGFKAAEEDKAVADYFTEYGSFPENFDPVNVHGYYNC